MSKDLGKTWFVGAMMCALTTLTVCAHVDLTWGNIFALPPIDGARANPGVARAYGG